MMLCHYTNLSQTIKVIRVRNISGFYLERTSYPSQSILFQAPIGAVLEVYAAPVTTLREDTIPCQDIKFVTNPTKSRCNPSA